MLLAPFTLTETPIRQQVAEASQPAVVPRWLAGWAILGSLAVLCVPALRGGPTTGLTLPFWLVVAPLLNIVWMTRKRWLPVGR